MDFRFDSGYSQKCHNIHKIILFHSLKVLLTLLTTAKLSFIRDCSVQFCSQERYPSLYFVFAKPCFLKTKSRCQLGVYDLNLIDPIPSLYCQCFLTTISFI